MYFNSEIEVLTSVKKNDSIVNNTIGQFMKLLEEMSQNGSDGVFGGIIKTEVKMSKRKIYLVVRMLNYQRKLKIKSLCKH